MSRRPAGPSATALLAAAVLTGCANAQPHILTGTASASHTLRVGLVEWRIISSGPELLPGADQLTVTNTGTTAHDLDVTGAGVHVRTSMLQPGQSATLSITAAPGTSLQLTCEVPGHEQAGMRSTVTVRR